MFKISGRRPPGLGVKDGRLKACGGKPNCVNSQATVGYAHIAPLSYTGDSTTALQKLADLVAAQPGAKIIAHRDNYLYAEFSTPFMGFVDDVEFYCDTASQKIQLRSASRLGYSDMGVNRKRIESLRQKFQA